MTKKRAIALFSGGKDSMYSIMMGAFQYEIAALILIVTKEGDAQLTDGVEVESCVIRDIASTLPFPYEEIAIENGPYYLDQLAHAVKAKMLEHDAELVITGDLDHPGGMDKVLLQKVGVITKSPAGDFYDKYGREAYIQELFNQEIKLVVSGVRGDTLPMDLIGKDFDMDSLGIVREKGLDITGEDGEFQTLVCDAPLMNKKIVINSFSLDKGMGRDNQGHLYSRMKDLDYSLENKW